MRLERFAVTGLLCALVVACREPIDPVNEGIVIQAVTPQTTGVVGELTESPPAVVVTSQSDGRPVKGVIVIFSPMNVQGGTVGAAFDTTDAAGSATARTWRLGPRAGLQQLDVFAPRYVRSIALSAIAKAGPVAQVTHQTSSKQYVLTGRQPVPPSVRVLDRYSNAVPGITIGFAAGPGGGSLDGTSGTTNTSGYATVTAWNLPAASGTYSATATFESLKLDFTAQRVDSSSLTWFALDSLMQGTKFFTPADYNIQDARLGVTPFDPCLCVNLDGVFFERLNYTGSPATHFEYGGSLTIANGKISMEFVDSVKVTPTAVLLKRGDYYYNTYTTYIYKRQP
jgi:Big-like domain-containing protein